MTSAVSRIVYPLRGVIVQIKLKRILVALMAGGLALPVVTHSADGDTDRSKPKIWVKDSLITTKIKAELAAKRLSSAVHIKVDTDADGFVMLSGNARTQAEVDQATQIARAVQGVKSVDNQIKVKAEL
jgi:hyperosmotically inducible periplasmic protein